MSEKLIHADEARRNSESFDLSCDQIVSQIGQLIDSNSKVGRRSVTAMFLKSAVTEEEMRSATDAIKARGYSIKPASSESESYAINIHW